MILVLLYGHIQPYPITIFSQVTFQAKPCVDLQTVIRASPFPASPLTGAGGGSGSLDTSGWNMLLLLLQIIVLLSEEKDCLKCVCI